MCILNPIFMSYDNTIINLGMEYYITQDDKKEAWFQKMVNLIKNTTLDKEQHSVLFDIIKILLCEANVTFQIYGKILAYLVYKEDRFNIVNSVEYKKYVCATSDNTVQKNIEHKYGVYIPKYNTSIFIQQAYRNLKKSDISLDEELQIWMDLRIIAKNSSIRALNHFSIKIIELFLHSNDEHNGYNIEHLNILYEEYKKKITSNFTIYNDNYDKYAVITQVNNIKNYSKFNILELKWIGLAGLLIELINKNCIVTACDINDLIFTTEQNYKKNEFKFYLIRAVTFTIIEIQSSQNKYDIYNNLINNLYTLDKCTFNSQCTKSITELYSILKILK